MNKILITGSTGMVGRNIVEYKEAQFYEILAPKREELNLLDKTQVLAYLKRHKPNIIVHCAGLVGGISANIANPVEFLSQNVSMGLNIIMAALECGVEKFLNIASSCMYPKEGKNPLSEDLILNGGLEPTNEGYALAKIVSTKLCEYILDSKNKLYKTAIPCNLYGKYDKFEINKAHMLPAVIAKIHSAKKSGAKEVEIWGSGKARREFMYVEDLADFVYYALKNFERMPKVLNVGRGEDFSITEYYEAIAEVIGYKGDFVYNTQKPEGMAQKLVDITHLKEFGWSSNTSLKEGIEKTYKYFLKGVTMQYYSLASSTWDYKELQAIEEVIKSDIFTMGTRVAEFEKNFAAYVGAKYAVMTSSGSTANLIATAALFYTSKHKLQRGDEVIVPAVSWATTYYPLYQYGLKLKFVDIDLETLNYDLEALSGAISEKTKMIMVVNLLGNPNDFDKIQEIIGNKDILLLEDNCESMGAEYKGKQAGTFGIMGTFSTFFSHHMATMEGGLVVTDDEELYHILLCLRAHGWTRNLPKDNKIAPKSEDSFSESFRFVLPGYNVRPVEMSGAIGIEQLKKLPNFLKHRRENAKIFKQYFQNHPDFMIQKEISSSSWFGFSLIIRKNSTLNRQEVIQKLQANNIECRPIVTGDFTQNEVMRFFDYEVFGILKNAQHLHKNGFFVGNHQVDIKDSILLLAEVLGGGNKINIY